MENTKQSFFPKLMSFIFIAMGLFLGFYAFFANATTWTLPGGSGWNNMTGYIDSTFWNNNPTTEDIIQALYGSGDDGIGTIYTQHWTGYTSGSCLSAGMTVEYISAGTSTIPLQLADNTIYILTGNKYITTGEINFGNCTALISQSGSSFYSTTQLTGLMKIEQKQFIVIDNVLEDGYNDGEGMTHSRDANGITITGSENITLNNMIFRYNGVDLGIACGIHMVNSNYTHIVNTEIFEDFDYGISLENSHFNIIEDSSFFGNGAHGMAFFYSHDNIINNVKSYNNHNGGVRFQDSPRNIINNSLSFNNEYGFYAGNNSTGLVLNNLSVFNNSAVGISFQSNSYGSILSNINSYNNGYYGILTTSSGTYYGNIRIFGNDYDIMTGIFTAPGTEPNVGWIAGTVNTGIALSRNYLINSQNGLSADMLNRNSSFSLDRGQKLSWDSVPHPVIYTYGGLIPKQIQSVRYSGSNLENRGTYISTDFIGSNQNFISGFIITQSTNIGAIDIYSSIDTYYRLFGTGLIIEEVGYLNTGTTQLAVTFSGGEGIKPIILQLGSGNNRATHYSTNIIYDLGDPIFTGATLSGDIVHNGGYYNTGITIIFYEPNLSGVTLSGLNNPYFSGSFTNGGLINSTGTYQFNIYDTVGHITGMAFTIDTEFPTLTGVINGSYYNTGVIITGIDTVGFSGFRINGLWYAGTSLITTGEGQRTITGYDYAGNTISTTFIIDTTVPTFTGLTTTMQPIISGGYYNTGVQITFYDLNISGATLNDVVYNSGDLISLQSGYIFFVSDLAGNYTGITFTIDTTIPSTTAIYPNTGVNITGTYDISFLRSGLDNYSISGYTIYVGSTGYTTTNTGYTINNMTNGTYTRYVVATDLAGNTGVSNSSTFRISTPLTGTAILSGGDMIKIGSVWYTNGYATFNVRANQPCIYTITGNYLTTFSGLYTSALTTLSSPLTGSDGDKTVYITFSTGAEIPIQITNTIKLDTVTYPATLISPLTGTTVSSGAINLLWNGSSTVESVGYSGYTYYLSDTGTFATVLTSGFTTTTGVSIVGTTITGVLYWKVDTLDKLGNTSGSSVGSFVYSNTADITPNSFSFSDVNDARRDRIYVSNTVYITGMTPGVNVLASINNGALYISGDMVGTTGFVQNGRPVKIELVSSDDYDETVSSTLTINGISDTFSITTMEEDEDTDTDTDYEDIETNLSNTEKLMIIAIFETLRDVYAGDKEEEFFNTFLVMLENKMDDFDNNDDEYDALKYLSDLVEQYYEGGDFGDNIDNKPWIINGIYTAPNSKKYTITYDSSKQRFTSTNFVVPKYFPTLDTLKYIIDINNPVGSQYANAKPILARWKTSAIDGTRQTSPYTAPNKKVFYFFKTIDGRYTSYTFTSERWFNSLNDVKEFIFNTNK